jgi:large subunit ribosomal protein L9
MLVILKENIRKVGKVGEVVTVTKGFARNFLIKQKRAVLATKEAIQMFEGKKEQLKAQGQVELAAAQEGLELINALGPLSIECNASDEGRLFGSINERDIVNLLKDRGVDIHYKDIILKVTIKTVGEYNVGIYLHYDITANVTLHVVKK